jgi:small subunit ribosomal protein S21
MSAKKLEISRQIANFIPALIKFELSSMLIIEVKDGESIDRALKRYKRKFQNTGIIKELRKRREFAKPSVRRRNQVLKAVYKEKLRSEEAG